MSKTNKSQAVPRTGGFRVGAKVLVPWGGGPVEGVIVEDRGFLGVGQRRLWGVKLFLKLPEPLYGEFGEDDIMLADPADAETVQH